MNGSNELNKFRALELAILLFAVPKDLNVFCLVCRRWQERFERDEYWYRHRNHVLKHIPSLTDLFQPREPIWKVFVKQLWRGLGGPTTFIDRFLAAPEHIQRAIVVTGHGDQSKIRAVHIALTGRIGVAYADGVVVTVVLRNVDKDKYFSGNASKHVTKMRKLAHSLPSRSKTIPVCTTSSYLSRMDGFIRQTWTNDSQGRNCPLQLFYGPYMDIVTCNPKGTRFRSSSGYADIPKRTNNVLYYEKPK